MNRASRVRAEAYSDGARFATRWSVAVRQVLWAQRLADGVEDIDEVARGARVAERRDPRQHVHLFGADIVCAPNAFVATEFLPRGALIAAVGGAEQIARAGIGEQVEFAGLQPQHFAKVRDHVL